MPTQGKLAQDRGPESYLLRNIAFVRERCWREGNLRTPGLGELAGHFEFKPSIIASRVECIYMRRAASLYNKLSPLSMSFQLVLYEEFS